MYVQSGFKTVTAAQLVNLLALLKANEISFRAFRVYFGCVTMIAVQEAVKRSGTRKFKQGGVAPARYRIHELTRLCGLTKRQIQSDLRKLERVGILRLSNSEFQIASEPTAISAELMTLIRSPNRPVPVPRAVLRYLARNVRPSIAKLMLAYMVRGLTLARQGGVVSGAGSVKAGWLSDLTGLSERAARYARKELIALNWIDRDTGSTQWKLNRHGAYFSINLDWRPKTSLRTGVTHPEIAPPEAANAHEIAPPIKDRKTPNGSKNQKTSAAGFQRKEEGGGGRELMIPSIQDVQHEDLFSLSRCEALYWQAVRTGLICHSEHSVLNFLAAAVRARSTKGGNAARIFSGILRRGLWKHITNEQEEVARKGLTKAREECPTRFRDAVASELINQAA